LPVGTDATALVSPAKFIDSVTSPNGAEQIRNTTSSGAKARHHLFFVPQRTSACIRELEEQGVYGDITIGDYNLDLVPLERDVLSLESTNAFKDLYLDGDTTCVYQLAKSIMKLQAVYGEIPRLVGKGDHAKVEFNRGITLDAQNSGSKDSLSRCWQISCNIPRQR
jgi:hypothetical protein